MVSLGDTARVSLKYRLQLPPELFGIFVFRDQQARRGVAILSEAIDAEQNEKGGFLGHRDKEEYVWHSGHPI